MGRFNGNNNLGTLEQFFERSSFSADAYPSGGSDFYAPPVRDFNFAERNLYGKVNKLHDPIQLRRENLVPLRRQAADSSEFRVLNFVADAFEELMVAWEGLAFRGRLDDADPILYEIEPQAAYVDYVQSYITYKIGLRQAFLQSYLTQERNLSILNFKDFMKIFLPYLEELSATIPITRSAFIPSKFSSPLISGLCIEIGQYDASDDSVKENFINSPNFEYYKLVARSKGFSIDKQAPWRLIADIASPQMLAFAARYGQGTTDRVLRNYYSRVGGADIRELIELAVDTYNSLVDQEPILRTKVPLACVSEQGASFVTRPRAARSRVLEEYSLPFWLDNYINIRYNEQRKPLSEGAMNEIRKVVNDLLQNTSEQYCLTYINNNIKTFDNFRGSYADRTLSRENAANNTSISPTY